MSENSRQNILNKIAAAQQRRLAVINAPTVKAEDIYKQVAPDSITCFKTELETINGKCILCKDEESIYSQLSDFLKANQLQEVFCKDSYISGQLKKYNISATNDSDKFESMIAGITTCEFLVARTGSVIVSSASESGRQMNVFPPIHIVIAHASQIVNYPEDALIAMQEKYGEHLPSCISTITGPSRTADIEKTLVLGAHGPKEFVVFLAEL